MRWKRLSILVLSATFGVWQSAFAAMVSPSLAKTKTEAEARGYIFLTNHDEIIAEEYGPYQKKFDILGMSQNGVIQIHPNMIDPRSRSAASVTDMIQIGVTYNKNVIAREKTPETWEDYLKPEFKGKKIMVDIRPTEIAALVPAWGLEKTLDHWRKPTRFKVATVPDLKRA